MKSKKRGMIMVITMMLLPICVILGSVLLSNILAEKNNLRYERATGRSFYLAEIGVNAAYYAFRSSNSEGFTHIKEPGDGLYEDGAVVSVNRLQLPPSLTAKIPFVAEPGGWYLYESTSSTALMDPNIPEKIRFRVSSLYDPVAEGRFDRPAAWEIVCEATLGKGKTAVTRTHRLTGYMEGLSEYAIFDSGDLNEFIRGANQTVSGPVHANGEIYLKPSGSTLTILSDSFTSAGNIWWGVDATGRTNMGNVKFASEDETTLPLLNWPTGLDHRDADWVTDALSLFGGRVQDQSMGVQSKQTPTVETFETGGFYYNTAQTGGLLISKDVDGNILVNGDPIASSALGADGTIVETTFYNQAEKRNVDTVMIDVSKLDTAEYPNGLVYSEVPMALKNGQLLPQNSSFVSQSTIYTLGDFNKELATLDDYQRHYGQGPYAGSPEPTHSTKKSAAILTKDRIWHLSKNFDFSTSAPSKPAASEPPEYAGDDEHVNSEAGNGSKDVIEINSMLIDGAPLYDETWNRDKNTDLDGDGIPDPNAGPLDANGEAASWDDYLESFGGGRVVKKRGSIVHLQNGKMADWPIGGSAQDPADETEVAWYKKISYDPPTRDYAFDPVLRATPPPFVTRIAYKANWTRSASVDE